MDFEIDGLNLAGIPGLDFGLGADAAAALRGVGTTADGAIQHADDAMDFDDIDELIEEEEEEEKPKQNGHVTSSTSTTEKNEEDDADEDDDDEDDDDDDSMGLDLLKTAMHGQKNQTQKSTTTTTTTTTTSAKKSPTKPTPLRTFTMDQLQAPLDPVPPPSAAQKASLPKFYSDKLLASERDYFSALYSPDGPILRFSDLFGPDMLGVDEARRALAMKNRQAARKAHANSLLDGSASLELELQAMERQDAEAARAEALAVAARARGVIMNMDDEQAFLYDDEKTKIGTQTSSASTTAAAEQHQSDVVTAHASSERRVSTRQVYTQPVQPTSDDMLLDDEEQATHATIAAPPSDAAFSGLTLAEWDHNIVWRAAQKDPLVHGVANDEEPAQTSDEAHDTAADDTSTRRRHRAVVPERVPTTPSLLAPSFGAVVERIEVQPGEVRELGVDYRPTDDSILVLHVAAGEVTPANPNPLPVPGRVHLNSYTPVIAGTLRIVLGMNVPNFIGDWQLIMSALGVIRGQFKHIELRRGGDALRENMLGALCPAMYLKSVIDGNLLTLSVAEHRSGPHQIVEYARTALQVPSGIDARRLYLKRRLGEVDSNDTWLDDVIFTEEDALRAKPTPLIVDANDPNMLLADRCDYSDEESDSETDGYDYSEDDEDDEDQDDDKATRRRRRNNPDSHYETDVKISSSKLSQTAVQHSRPAQQISTSLFSLDKDVTDQELEYWHRPRGYFTAKSNGEGKRHPIYLPAVPPPKIKHTVPQTVPELSGSNSDKLVTICEYFEARPPLMLNVGMAFNLKNYHRKVSENVSADELPTFPEGETVVLEPNDTSPFVLGDVKLGDTVRAFDTPLFKAPIFEHKLHPNDFLLVRSQRDNSFVIRELSSLWLVGQEQPCIEVPAPNSRPATKIARNRMAAYITRQFRKRPIINIADVSDAFPLESDGAVRKRLQAVAEPKRSLGPGTGWWVHKKHLPLATDDELLGLITPEMVCAHDSMRAGQYYLNQRGIRRLLNLSGPLTQLLKEIEPDHPLRTSIAAVRGELLQTSWQTTESFLKAKGGKCTMRLTGTGDPSRGRGFGFAYVRKEAVRGVKTDVRFRDMSRSDVQEWLKSLGFPPSSLDELSRNQTVALARQVITHEGDVIRAYHSFKRAGKKHVPESEAYASQVAEIFQKQIVALSDKSGQFPDEEDDYVDSDEEDEQRQLNGDADALTAFGRELESELLGGGIQMTDKDNPAAEYMPRVRDARTALSDFVAERGSKKAQSVAVERALKAAPKDTGPVVPRCPAVRRTVLHTQEDGTIHRRVEIVRDPRKINQLLQKRDERINIQPIGDKKKMKDQLQKLKKHKRALEEGDQEVGGSGGRLKQNAETTCSACKQTGHKKSNRACPRYYETHPNAKRKPATQRKPRQEKIVYDSDASDESEASLSDLTSDEEEEDILDQLPSDDEDSDADIEDKKIKSKKRKSSTNHKPDNKEDESGYQPSKRQRHLASATGAQVALNSILDNIILDINKQPVAEPFLQLVAERDLPDYYKEIEQPLCLDDVRRKTKEGEYFALSEFLQDISLIKNNCIQFNSVEGRWPNLITDVNQLVSEIQQRIQSNQKEINEAETVIKNANLKQE